MKTCSKCNIEKDENEFRWRNKSKGWRSPWCKPCYKAYEKNVWKTSKKRRDDKTKQQAVRRLRNSQYVYDILSKSKCVDCGNDNPIVLEFDHLDPKLKSENVSTLTRSVHSTKIIQEEIDKCEVVCSNCHKIRTAKTFNWYKKLIKTQV